MVRHSNIRTLRAKFVGLPSASTALGVRTDCKSCLNVLKALGQGLAFQARGNHEHEQEGEEYQRDKSEEVQMSQLASTLAEL